MNPSCQRDYDLMMSSGFYESAVSEGLLIRHEEVDDVGPARAAYKNVQFLRGRCVFIDTLSFQAYPEDRPWVAYQQFCRHFLAPLALMAYTHVELAKLLRVNMDGVPLDLAARLLPQRTWLRPSLLTHLHLHGRMQQTRGNESERAEKARSARVSRTALLGLLDSLTGAVRRLEWSPSGTEWVDYYEDTNYSEAAREHKLSVVAEFLAAARPTSVWDLGANTGVFTRLASARGIRSVAFDVDPAAVEKNYLAARATGEENLLPVVMDLANPSPGLGWDGAERSSLFERGPADVALALALVHHLAIGNNVPLPRIADCLQRLGRRLIVEFVPKSDSQVERMLATREDIFPGYTQEGFEKAFLGRFSLLDQRSLVDCQRTLYLFEAKPSSQA